MAATENSLHISLAIRAIARSRYEYNLGVLSVLGHRDLAIAHQMAAIAVARQKDELEKQEAEQRRGTPWAEGARDAALLALSEAISLEEKTWAPIQALIDGVPDIEGALFKSSSHASLGP